jgi:hypothetical protein
MNDEELLEYFEYWKTLDIKNINIEDNSEYQKVSDKFLKNFPDTDNLDIVINYIKKFDFGKEELNNLKIFLDKKAIFPVYQNIKKHYEIIIQYLIPKNKELKVNEKKKIYLGVLWFCIGFYICLIIKRIVKLENKIILSELATNNYIVFLTCCFIFYDNIFDSPIIGIKDKKLVIDFTKHFFDKVSDLEMKFDNIKEDFLINYYYNINNEIKNDNDIRNDNEIKNNILNNEILQRTINLLNVFYKEYRKDKNNERRTKILKVIKKLFYTEIETSKKQKITQDEKEIFKITLLKSYVSIETIFTLIFPENDITDKIKDIIKRFALLSQLMDDLNDIVIDLEENNNTLFTLKDNKGNLLEDKIDLNIRRLLKLIDVINIFINENLPESKNNMFYKTINSYMTLLVLNYSLGKNNKSINKYNKYFLLSEENILILREKKYLFIKKQNF